MGEKTTLQGCRKLGKVANTRDQPPLAPCAPGPQLPSLNTTAEPRRPITAPQSASRKEWRRCRDRSQTQTRRRFDAAHWRPTQGQGGKIAALGPGARRCRLVACCLYDASGRLLRTISQGWPGRFPPCLCSSPPSKWLLHPDLTCVNPLFSISNQAIVLFPALLPSFKKTSRFVRPPPSV